MTEPTSLARVALGQIVDRLLAENPELVEQYNTIFAEGGGAEWITHGVSRRATDIDDLVQEMAEEVRNSADDGDDGDDDENFGLADLFKEDGDDEEVEFTDEEFLEDEFECIGGDVVPA